MDKERILQVVLTLAIVGSLALVAGALVTGQSDEWNSREISGWRQSQADRRAIPPNDMEAPKAPSDIQLPPIVPPTGP
jgi:hypothetical protein